MKKVTSFLCVSLDVRNLISFLCIKTAETVHIGSVNGTKMYKVFIQWLPALHLIALRCLIIKCFLMPVLCNISVLLKFVGKP